ncbi:MFS transporter [Caulobacter sp. NIBR1757]|uniref:MFS transporter n=1 Tax=Caulobacter sp. NIBR1757 TaxID=3016000 RepID=UPI0022F0989E|nr:MFS transporter [Caulobacter sp. NIBR1757]WGM40664.1 Inner membrane symporter YicJ [Caulobacter sp. NIBR1757]
MSAADEATTARHAPLTRRFKAAYGTGAIADGVAAAGFGFFLLFYLTAVCGMSGTAAGTAKLIALLIDGVADPAIGLASDRLRSRFGRRLPFMVGGLLPFACAFGLIFSMPASLTGLPQFLYVTVCLVVLRLSLSFFVLPFTAVGAEVTDDYRERASVVAFRLSFQNIGILLGVVLGLGVFMAGPEGLLGRQNYAPFAWTCAAVMLLTGSVAIAAVRQALPRLHGPETGGGHFLSGFGREMVELARNRSFLILFGTVLTYFLAYSAHVSLALHASRYFWKLDTSAIQIILLSTTLGPLLGAPISAFALRHIEKRTLSIAAFLSIAVLLSWPPLLQLYGPAPLTPTMATVVLFINGLLVGTAIMIGGIGFQSMLADTADEHEWLFGVRREGLFFSGLTLAYKAASGLGGLIAGLALDAIRFPTDLAARGPGLVIPGPVLDRLALISGPLPAAFAALAPLFLIGYHLTRQKHARIIAELEQRNGRTGA